MMQEKRDRVMESDMRWKWKMVLVVACDITNEALYTFLIAALHSAR